MLIHPDSNNNRRCDWIFNRNVFFLVFNEFSFLSYRPTLNPLNPAVVKAFRYGRILMKTYHRPTIGPCMSTLRLAKADVTGWGVMVGLQ